jgi:hypothetical protein
MMSHQNGGPFGAAIVLFHVAARRQHAGGHDAKFGPMDSDAAVDCHRVVRAGEFAALNTSATERRRRCHSRHHAPLQLEPRRRSGRTQRRTPALLWRSIEVLRRQHGLHSEDVVDANGVLHRGERLFREAAPGFPAAATHCRPDR